MGIWPRARTRTCRQPGGRTALDTFPACRHDPTTANTRTRPLPAARPGPAHPGCQAIACCLLDALAPADSGHAGRRPAPVEYLSAFKESNMDLTPREKDK